MIKHGMALFKVVRILPPTYFSAQLSIGWTKYASVFPLVVAMQERSPFDTKYSIVCSKRNVAVF
jgi:hypothetical protein